MITQFIDKVTFESTETNGFCEVRIDKEEDGSKWIELHGNELNPDFPLVLASEKDIDDFANFLKALLK